MSDTYETGLKVSVTTDGTEGLTALQKTLQALAEATKASYEKMATSVEQLNARTVEDVKRTTKAKEDAEAAHQRAMEKLRAQASIVRAKTKLEDASERSAAAKHNSWMEQEAARTQSDQAAIREKFRQKRASDRARAAQQAVADANAQANKLAQIQATSAAKTQQIQAKAQATANAQIQVSQQQQLAQAAKANAAAQQQAQAHQNTLTRIIARGGQQQTLAAQRAAQSVAAAEAQMANIKERNKGRITAALLSRSGGGLGLGGLLAGAGGLVSGHAIYEANVKDQAVLYSLMSSEGGNKALAEAVKAQFKQLSAKHGVNFYDQGDRMSGMYASARAGGMSTEASVKLMDDTLMLFNARHLSNSQQQRAMMTMSESLSGTKLQRREALRNFGMMEAPGTGGDMKRFLADVLPEVFGKKGEFFAEVLGGKEGANGKKYDVDAQQFWPQFLEWEKAHGAGAADKEATEHSPQAAFNRFKQQLSDLFVQFGNSGASQAFVNVLKSLSGVMQDPSFVKNVQAIGRGMADLSKSIGPAVSSTVEFVKEHKTFIKYSLEAYAGLKLFSGGLSLLLSPFASIVSSFTLLKGVFGPVLTGFGNVALWLGRVTGLTGPLASSLAGVVMQFGLAGGGIRGFMSVLGGLAPVFAQVAVAVGGIYAAWKLASGVMHGMAADKAMGVDVSKAPLAQVAEVKKTIEQDKEDNSRWYRKLPVWLGSKVGLTPADALQTRNQKDDAKLAQIGAREVADRVKASNEALAQKKALEKAAATPAVDPKSMLTAPTGHTKTKGGGGGAAPDLAAERTAAETAYNDRRETARKTYQDELANIKELVETYKLGFKEAFDKKTAAAKTLYDQEVALIKEKDEKEIAIAKEKLARDSSRKGGELAAKADRTALETLTKSLADKLKTVKKEYETTLKNDATDYEQKTKAYESRMAAIRRANNKDATGLEGFDAEAIRAQYADDLGNAKANNDTKALEAIEHRIKAETIHGEVSLAKENIDLRGGNLALEADKLNAAQEAGLLTRKEAEAQILALKKQQAAQDIQAIQDELKKNLSVKDELELKKLLLQKQIELRQQTADQKALESGLRSDTEAFLDAVTSRTKSITVALKDLFKSISSQLNKQFAANVSDGLMNQAKQFATNNEGAGGLAGGLSGLASSLLGWGNASKNVAQMQVASMTVASLNGGMTGATGGGSAGGGLLSSIFGGIGSLFGGGDMESFAGTGSALALDTSSLGFDTSGLSSAMSGISSMSSLGSLSGLVSSAAPAAARMVGGGITMNISTPDANSFRQSTAQLMSEAQIQSSIAAGRN